MNLDSFVMRLKLVFDLVILLSDKYFFFQKQDRRVYDLLDETQSASPSSDAMIRKVF